MSVSASEMTYIVLGGMINSTHSLTLMSSPELINVKNLRIYNSV